MTSYWYVVPTGGSQEIRENYSVKNGLKKTDFMFTYTLYDDFQQLTVQKNKIMYYEVHNSRQTDRKAGYYIIQNMANSIVQGPA